MAGKLSGARYESLVTLDRLRTKMWLIAIPRSLPNVGRYLKAAGVKIIALRAFSKSGIVANINGPVMSKYGKCARNRHSESAA